MSTSWLSGVGMPISVYEIIKRAKTYVAAGGTIYIGTDSYVSNQICTLASTICFHGAPGSRGGFYYFKKDTLNAKHFRTVRQRIMHEVQSTINLATFLNDHGVKQLEVHIDVSPSSGKTKTSLMADQLVGYVRGVGFSCKIKPDAWAAASIADKHSK